MAAGKSRDDLPQTHVSLNAGTRTSHYRVIKKLGSGGMGEVYLAQDESLDRLVALKTLPSRLAEVPQFRRRLKREARANARLTHQNICRVYAVEETEIGLLVSMEYVQGATLSDHVGTSLDIERISDITKQCCNGLQAAHEEGVVHCDIKSSNIMLDKYGTVKILDFGLAKVTSNSDDTVTAGIVGTYHFMSPEQITGKVIDHRSDIFSLGVVIYELITGRVPFEGDNLAAIAYSIVHNDPDSVRLFRNDVTPVLEHVVERALSKHVDRRYQTVLDMLQDLRKVKRIATSRRVVTSYKKRAIAVFPFSNLSGDADSGYLSEGICDDVITAISKIPQLTVASRTAVTRLVKRDMDPLEICRELNAEHILEGSFRRVGDLIRLNAQITRANDGYVIWSQAYERESEDHFLTLSDIVSHVAAALNVALSGSDLPTADHCRVMNPRAYELYLQGRFYLKRRNEASLRKAIDLFSEAIHLDSHLGAAYAELAAASALCDIYGYKRIVRLKGGTQEWAAKSIDLNPGSSQAHMAMFFVLRRDDIRRATSELRTAIALDESNSEAYHYLAHSLVYCGHYSGAEKAETAANILDPFMEMSDSNLCHIYFLTDQESQLAEQLKSMQSKHGQSHIVSSTKGWIEWCQRRWDVAAAHYQLASSKEPSDSVVADHLADCLVRIGKADQAIDVLEESLSRNPDSGMLQARLGQAHSARGEVDGATGYFDLAENGFSRTRTANANLSTHDHFNLAWLSSLKRDKLATIRHLRSAIALGYGNYAELRVRPDWDILRGDAEFDSMMRTLEREKTSEG